LKTKQPAQLAPPKSSKLTETAIDISKVKYEERHDSFALILDLYLSFESDEIKLAK